MTDADREAEHEAYLRWLEERTRGKPVMRPEEAGNHLTLAGDPQERATT